MLQSQPMTFDVLERIQHYWSWTHSSSHPSTDLLSNQSVSIDGLPVSDTIYNNQQLSLSDIINSINHTNLTTNLTTTAELEQRYKTTQDPELGRELIGKLVQEFEFTKAYTLLNTLDSATIKTIDPHVIMRVLFNSELIVERTQNLTYIENMIEEFRIAWTLDVNEAQRYKALLLLSQYKIDEFVWLLPVFDESSSSIIKPLVTNIRQKIWQSTQGNDIPSVYKDWLIALWVFQYGYPYLAQQLSFRILAQQPTYILPIQILAYSNMILKERSQAQSYFLQLMTTDPNNIGNYQFFAGVCSYWMSKYTDAILYLNQISANTSNTDILRYKILSYIAIQDRKNATSVMRFMINQETLNDADMLFAWEEIIFKPYISQSTYHIFENDNAIVDIYLNRCLNSTAFNPLVCEIWTIAANIKNNTLPNSITQINSIINQYPRSYMYYILWEAYLLQDNNTEAQKAFVAALARSSDPLMREKITAKIRAVL